MSLKKKLNNRENFGIFTACVGIFTNLFLSAGKIFVGIFSGAISIIADGLNNLSDASSSIVMLIGFKISAKPADFEHPFGHGRAEYLAGFFISIAMIFVGLEFFTNSIKKIFYPETLAIDNFTIFALIISVIFKIFLGFFYKFAAKKINSETIKTAAIDSFTDCIATFFVIISAILYKNFNLNIDGIAGAIVSILILYGGVDTLKNILNPLLGEKPDEIFIENIKKIVVNTPDILGVHDMIFHAYGANKIFVSMHVEIRADMKFLDAHEIVDKLERKLQSEFNIFVTIHIDPIVTNDAEFDNLIKISKKILQEIDENLSLHDFRVVPYKSGKKLIFDVKIPEKFFMNDRDLRREFLRKLIKIFPTYRVSIHCDHEYC